MERSDLQNDVIKACHELGVGYTPFMPLAAGFLTGMIKPGMTFTGDDAKRFSDRFSDESIKKNQPILEVLDKVSKAKNCSYAQAALAWLLYQDEVIVPIAGAMKEEFLRANMDVPKIQFTKEEIAIAKENGFVIVTGASDDLVELEGAITDEGDCWEGGEICVRAVSGGRIVDSCTDSDTFCFDVKWCKDEDVNGEVIPWTYQMV